MAEVIEDHVIGHMANAGKRSPADQARAAQDAVAVIKAYLK